MKAILWVLLTIAVTLLLLAGVVFGLGDKTVMVAPPESITEGFMRSLSTRRYDQALTFLHDNLKKQTPTDDLKAFTQRIEREHGGIQNVSGEPIWIKGDRAEASAFLQTQRVKEVEIKFKLERDKGEWVIGEIGGRNK